MYAALQPTLAAKNIAVADVLGNPDAARQQISACISTFLPPLQKAGVNLGNLLPLQQCAAVPKCTTGSP